MTSHFNYLPFHVNLASNSLGFPKEKDNYTHRPLQQVKSPLNCRPGGGARASPGRHDGFRFPPAAHRINKALSGSHHDDKCFLMIRNVHNVHCI